jgi:hypothetical protein
VVINGEWERGFADDGVGEYVVYERLSGWATVSDLHTEGKYEG